MVFGDALLQNKAAWWVALSDVHTNYHFKKDLTLLRLITHYYKPRPTRTKMAPKGNALLQGTAALVATINPCSIAHDPESSVTPQNVTVLTSYDLLPKWQKAIIVPGSPPVWSPSALPITIPADKGVHSIDPVRLIFPQCPLEPLFRALEISKPLLKLSDFDIISDRRNLRALLAYAGGSRESFRIDAEIAPGEKTLMFSVWTGKLRSYANGTAACGYGMTFEEKFTKRPACSRGSIRHNRAVGYSFGGLQLMVRFEVDACIGGRQGVWQPRVTDTENTVTVPTGVKVFLRGKLAAPESIVELKTVRCGTAEKPGKSATSSQNIAQLWFSRTPILIAGKYQGEGRFVRVEQTDVIASGRMKQWEETNTEKLQKLVKLLGMLKEIMVSAGNGKFALVLEKGSADLKIFALDQSKYQFGLPEDIKEKWN